MNVKLSQRGRNLVPLGEIESTWEKLSPLGRNWVHLEEIASQGFIMSVTMPVLNYDIYDMYNCHFGIIFETQISGYLNIK